MDWFVVIYLVVIVLVFIAVIVFSLWRYRTIKRLMEDHALKRNGIVEGSLLLPRLKFSYRNLQFLVTSVPGSKYRPAKTEVSVTLFKPLSSTVTIYRETVASRFGKMLGAKDIQLGSDEFDREYMIKGDDELFVRNLINLTVQNKLLEMKHEKPQVSFYGTWLTVRVPKVLTKEDQYDQLFDLAFTLIDRTEQL